MEPQDWWFVDMFLLFQGGQFSGSMLVFWGVRILLFGVQESKDITSSILNSIHLYSWVSEGNFGPNVNMTFDTKTKRRFLYSKKRLVY